MIKKNSIVWYWHRKDKRWRKGKVISLPCFPFSTRPIGLYIKNRSTRKKYLVPYSHTAVLATEPKPTHTF